MRTSKDLNRVIARLRKVNRKTAENHARAYAESLLVDAARHRSMTDLAALAIMSIALYCAAATCIVEEHGFCTVQRIIDRWYALLRDGNSAEHVFAQSITYPPDLERNRRNLMQLPAPSLAAGLTMARQALTNLEKANRE